MNNSWFVIVNPVAGNGKFNKYWSDIQQELKFNNITYEYAKTEYSNHEKLIVQQAINKGYKKIISVGGDGTLHHVVNGIMSQDSINSKEITVAVIPLGTGNDWIKTYNIPKNIKASVNLIKQENTVFQDIGYLELANTTSYFNNVAGIGYDGYVVNKLNKLKRFGPIAYLLSGIAGLLLYKKTTFKIAINNKIIETKCLMTLFGICKYSAGGMQLTDFKYSNNGLFDITIAKNLSFWDLFFSIKKLYNGKILQHKKVETLVANSLLITPQNKNDLPYIQADGELIGRGQVKVNIIKSAIQIVIP
ncbi:diacylglycerol kinase [Tenacibaculum discolor]|uniref:Diacylglycerol kinase n=1 Tax=Tenacibaculum discolor TaxID=361581 RepID=A0A2G1BVJ8_9FLAO|nr:diacylglycerol kinase family protein [Tenacibaculum discolor]MDP2540074.1 diacylglycerol kinase family lipid kinase [Tenacibaculum discolor]PHN98028.1 diacylglycerol kinase [Tenacibaculum discolor]PHO01464.1 diacylglycerol kinase [Rhodobacteraceae bacterium 4F10]